jgi:hypothetical protein
MARKDKAQTPKVTPGSGIDNQIAELNIVKSLVELIKHLPKDGQERVLTITGEYVDCWPKRTRVNKKEAHHVVPVEDPSPTEDLVDIPSSEWEGTLP